MRRNTRTEQITMKSKPKHKLPPWLRPKDAVEDVLAGVAWYSPEQWALVKASATDPEGFEASFQAWLAVAEAGLKTLRAAGIIGKPYLINAEELLAWCLMRNRPNNSSSRSEFVAERLQAEDESSNIS